MGKALECEKKKCEIDKLNASQEIMQCSDLWYFGKEEDCIAIINTYIVRTALQLIEIEGGSAHK